MSTTYPLLARGAVTSLLSAILACLIVFGVPLSPEQSDALLVLEATATPIILSLWAQRHVTPYRGKV